MPTYLYFCHDCQKEFEAEHSMSEELTECPTCQKLGKEPHPPKRLIAAGTNFILSDGGVGWAKDHYSK